MTQPDVYDDDDYEKWTTEALQEQSSFLYEQYLKGDDVLTDLHRIAEILRERET